MLLLEVLGLAMPSPGASGSSLPIQVSSTLEFRRKLLNVSTGLPQAFCLPVFLCQPLGRVLAILNHAVAASCRLK
jgi:hypothetical protein